MDSLKNMGSIIKIEIAPASNITIGLPNPNNQVVVNDYDFWDNIVFTQQSASFSETNKLVNEGLRYDDNISWKTAKQTPDNFAIAHKYDNVGVVIKITDANNIVYLIGSNIAPTYIRVSSSVPQTPGSYNGYKFSVKYQSSHPAYFVVPSVSGPVPHPHEPPPPPNPT